MCRLLALLLSLSAAQLLRPSVGNALPSPPAGWNAWFALHHDVNESGVRANADALVRLGLKDAGYTFVNLDDLWAGGRDAKGTLFSDAVRFPSNISALSSYVHSLDMMLGIYTDRGPKTCGGREGSAGYEAHDAMTFAAWGVDFVKEDSCDATKEHHAAIQEYARMGAGLKSSGRHMFFSLCGWMKWYAGRASADQVGNSWRIGPDASTWHDFLVNVDAAADTAPFASAGRYNDMDEIAWDSRGDYTMTQTFTQFCLIAIVGSPLLLSFKLSHRSVDEVAWLTNPEVLAVHRHVSSTGELVYRRLVGGPVDPFGSSPATRVPCNSGDPSLEPSLLWTLKQPNASDPSLEVGSMLPGGPPLCLRTSAMGHSGCGHAEEVLVRPCAARPCCSADCSDTRFVFEDAGNGWETIRSLYKSGGDVPGPYLTVDMVPNSVYIQDRLSNDASGSQLFRFEAVGSNGSGILQSWDGSCLSARRPDTKAVWGRQLAANSSWALLFINFDPRHSQNVTCSAECFREAGFPEGAFLSIRDLWHHTENGTVSTNEGLTLDLPPNGASTMVKVQLAQQAWV